jgi:hypothetical protein
VNSLSSVFLEYNKPCQTAIRILCAGNPSAVLQIEICGINGIVTATIGLLPERFSVLMENRGPGYSGKKKNQTCRQNIPFSLM